ncbi:hypothetical protein LCGC14_1090630 [marine sediment metagenome]|uniref:Uncharacterized protein n=1 Tax=marine sediment metagenome TaxID=412755 RepID=A0A0F9QIG1_9ZZZZ
MSLELPPFIKFSFMTPNFVLDNKETGEPVFEMKRKTPTQPDGTEECYYLFKFYDENMPDDEAKAQIHEFFEEGMCPLALLMGIGVFSFDEVSERCTEQVKLVYQGGGELTESQIDVEIKIYNHATKKIHDLTVGLSTMPYAGSPPAL